MANLRVRSVSVGPTTAKLRVRAVSVSGTALNVARLRVRSVAVSGPAVNTAFLRVKAISVSGTPLNPADARLRVRSLAVSGQALGILTASTLTPDSGGRVALVFSGDPAVPVVWRIVSSSGGAPALSASGFNAEVGLAPVSAKASVVIGAKQGSAPEATVTLTEQPAVRYRMRQGALVPVANLVLRGSGITVPDPTPAVDTTPPSIPAGVTASNLTPTGFTLSWSASSDDVGVSGYEVQVDGAVYATTSGTTVVVSGRTAATSYAVRVRAQDTAGNYSPLSSAVTVTTPAPPAPPTPTPQTLFTTQVPAAGYADGPYTLTTRFVSDAAGQITGLRVYGFPGMNGMTNVIGLLYADDGSEIRRATVAGPLADGWNTITFASPFAIQAGVYYRVGYYTSLNYAASGGFFATPLVNGHLTGTGGYYSGGSLPESGAGFFNNGCYFADPIFLPAA